MHKRKIQNTTLSKDKSVRNERLNLYIHFLFQPLTAYQRHRVVNFLTLLCLTHSLMIYSLFFTAISLWGEELISIISK